MPVEEIKIDEDPLNKKKNRQRRNMEAYAPLIFEECYVKNKQINRIVNSFEI